MDYSTRSHRISPEDQETVGTDEEKERWKTHELYRTKTKPQSEAQCQTLKILATPALTKHQLVRMISEKRGENSPQLKQPLYSGKLVAVPDRVTELSVAVLRTTSFKIP